MAKGDYLGEFEQLILTALMILRENAYGIPTFLEDPLPK
jgi:hypothetical protein